MLSIIFFLLKIIGLLLKVVGIVLLIVLLLVAFIALVPIRYRFAAKIPEQKKASQVDVTVRWFGFLLVVKGAYQKGSINYLVKIFGHQIIGNQPEFIQAQKEKEQKKKEKKQKKHKKRRKEKSKKRTDNKEKRIKKSVEESVPKTEEIVKASPIKTAKTEETPKQKQEQHRTQEVEKKPKEESIFSKGKSLVNQIKEIWEEYHICDNLGFIKDILWKTLRHVLPRKLKGHLAIGLESPEWMGYLTAVMAMMYPVYGKHLVFTPYFQETKLEADCEGRGRIRLGFFGYIGIRLLMNKEVRKIIFG